jgi:hypothetical protein
MRHPDAAEFLKKSLIKKEFSRDAATTKQAPAYLNMDRISIYKYLWLLRNKRKSG